MRQWLDVLPGDWFYNEVLEATNYILEDGKPLIEGAPYNRFIAPKVYQEFTSGGGQVDFTLDLPEDIVPTPANPIYVYVDGVQTIHKKITGNTVTLYAPPRKGAKVAVMMQGKPWVDADGRPSQISAGVYPNKTLDHGERYYWNPLDGRHLEYVYAYGKALKRAPIPVDEWLVSSPQAIVEKYIGHATDMYAVSPAEHPYAKGRVYLSMNLNNVTCTMVYYSKESDGTIVKRGGEFQCTSSSPLWNDRFFPDARLTRAEGYALIDRLRKSFYQRFTDLEPPNGNFTEYQTSYEGQRVFKLTKDRYNPGTGELKVYYIDGDNVAHLQVLGANYTEFDSTTILMTAPIPEGRRYKFVASRTSRFPDISSDDWWYENIVSMESERFGNGDLLIIGKPNPVAGQPPIFAPRDMLKRSEAAAFLNRFRKWCIERFKH